MFRAIESPKENSLFKSPWIPTTTNRLGEGEHWLVWTYIHVWIGEACLLPCIRYHLSPLLDES